MPEKAENMLDRLERLRAEPTKGITDPGAGDYSLLLLRMAPALISAARLLGAMLEGADVTSGDAVLRTDPESRLRLNSFKSWIVGPEFTSKMSAKKTLESARAAWEKVTR